MSQKVVVPDLIISAQAKKRSPIGQVWIDVFGFGRKYVIVQPVHQLQVIRYSAETGHRRVRMRVDETGQDQGIFAVNYFFRVYIF